MNKAKIIKKIKENVVGYALILPLLISLTVFTIYPLAMALFDSFFYDYIPRRLFFDRDWSLFGFDNYIKAFKTGDFQHSMKLTFIYAIVMIPSTLTISFFIAWQLNKKIAGIKVFRVLYYLPCLMPGIVSSIVYKYIFSPEPYGLLNTLYTSILGLDPTKVEPFKFLEAESQSTALISFMCTSIFGLSGSMPFWIAGFRSVSPSLIEAADLDGANGTQKMFLIIIPMMSKFIFYQLLMGVIGTFQIGQGVITLSPRGGYNGNLNFYGLLIYNTGYVGFNMGYGSALAYMLFIIIAILSIFTFRFNKFVYYEAED